MNKSEIEDFDTNLGLLADLYGVEYQSTPDMKVGMLKAMGILDKDFDYNTTNDQRFMENLIIVKELVRKKKDANFNQIVHHVPILRKNRENSIEISLPDGIKMLNEAMPTDAVLKIKSLEAFEKAADGKATKLIIPSEIQGIAGLAASLKETLTDK